ncbi:KAP family P-loop NTPase fold protein [Agrobacterium pusense]|uniref:KAP family P-loop NTPase fold protein n=1 Tax=Agrobacterium pusense TaxID=648995 RepID=UPI0022B8E15A|nr:P-loop NTPase fold protein [Agrobacterium pusense]MCZ7926159.1 P-loop NTPase fold protein [Agrobacterium pusense]
MTEEQNIWHDDRLGRVEDSDRLYLLTFNRHLENVAHSRGGSFVVNVDAGWGKGKSFLLSRMFKDVLKKGHPAVFINAWENDFIDDPFTIAVSALDEYVKSIVAPLEADKANPIIETAKNVRRNFGRIVSVVATDLAKTAATKLIGSGVGTVIDLATEEKGEARRVATEVGEGITTSLADLSNETIDDFAKSRLKDVDEAKQSVASFKKGLADLLAMIDKETDKKLPFYVFLDELDRCKPTYAIAMLERIKHLFDVSGVVFILATDTDQLGASIKSVYGNDFDSMHYLQRFFHRSYQLPDVDPYLIAYDTLTNRGIGIEKWGLPPNAENMDVRYVADFLANTSSHFSLSPRQFEQSIDILQDVTTVWPYDFRIELILMYPLICLYAKERKIDKEATAKLNRAIANSEKWTAEDAQNIGMRLSGYYSSIRDMMETNVYGWIIQRQRSNTISLEQSYVYEFGNKELNSMVKNGNRESYRSILNKYGDIILNNRTKFYNA